MNKLYQLSNNKTFILYIITILSMHSIYSLAPIKQQWAFAYLL